MNKICFLGFGKVGKCFVKKIIKSEYKLSFIGTKKINIKKKRYLENIHKKPNKFFIFIKYKRFIKKSNIIVELIGDTIFSKDIFLRTILSNRKCITANKKLIYKNIKIFENFLYKNIYFESSIGASIPIIYSINKCFCLYNVKKIISIINGTTNYILSKFCKKNVSFEKAVRICRKKGFAEKNSLSDISGFDSYNKLFIILNLLKIKVINIKNNVFGIEKIKKFKELIIFIKKKIKLIGLLVINKYTVFFEICPFLFNEKENLYKYKGIENVLEIKTNKDNYVISGPGAGANSTSMSVISDVFLEKYRVKKVKKVKKFFLNISTKKIYLCFKKKTNIKRLFFLNLKFFFFKKKIFLKIVKKIDMKRIYFIKNLIKKNIIFISE
ncbi:hypothetical protein ACWNX6_00545 [Candidatus Vidania fulgoroideorum]